MTCRAREQHNGTDTLSRFPCWENNFKHCLKKSIGLFEAYGNEGLALTQMPKIRSTNIAGFTVGTEAVTEEWKPEQFMHKWRMLTLNSA